LVGVNSVKHEVPGETVTREGKKKKGRTPRFSGQYLYPHHTSEAEKMGDQGGEKKSKKGREGRQAETTGTDERHVSQAEWASKLRGDNGKGGQGQPSDLGKIYMTWPYCNQKGSHREKTSKGERFRIVLQKRIRTRRADVKSSAG